MKCYQKYEIRTIIYIERRFSNNGIWEMNHDRYDFLGTETLGLHETGWCFGTPASMGVGKFLRPFPGRL